jgi:hypothetical protein
MTDRRKALGLGLVASAVALSGRSTARAADALSIDADGVNIDRPMKILGDNTLEFGAGVNAKQGDAGKIGYGVFEGDSLTIVGAGTKDDNRKITFWAEGGAKFNGPLKIGAKNTLEFGSGVSGKQGDAGKIGYGVFEDDSLCIVGAGTKGDNRKITFFAEGGAEFRGSLTVAGLSVPGAQETLRLLRGVITKEGSKFAGEGFTVNPVGPGRGFYDIVFEPSFASIPGASVTQIYQSIYRGNQKAEDQGGKTADNAVIAHLSADRMRVKTGDNSGNEEQRAFSFVVIGPR